MNSIEQIKKHFISYLKDTYAFDETRSEKGTFELNTDEQKQQFGDNLSVGQITIIKYTITIGIFWGNAHDRATARSQKPTKVYITF